MDFEARIKAVRDAREAKGLNVRFVRDDGVEDSYSFASPESADRFRQNLRRLGRVILP